VGGGAPCYLVAEIGINHNGNIDLAKAMIDAAQASGADAAKFQNYRTEDFIRKRALTYTYTSNGREVTEPQYDLFKRCELDPKELAALKRHCDAAGIGFHSTPTSAEGVRDLVALGVGVLKNGSDCLTHLPLIEAMGASGLPTVISTGMSTRAEIEAAVRRFRATGNQKLILLHCTSSYPAAQADLHLRKIPALAAAYNCLVGFSDHSRGPLATAAAVALGACWIEKHFTLSHDLPGPDQWFSSEPAEFATLVETVRTVESSLGSDHVGPTAAEEEMRRIARLSCVAARPLAAGTTLEIGDIAFQRPGTGLSPVHAQELVGRSLRRAVDANHIFSDGDFAGTAA
jgi:N-acetylneuraminate synthase/N,N'-diacetyllegionaminate synthase